MRTHTIALRSASCSPSPIGRKNWVCFFINSIIKFRTLNPEFKKSIIFEKPIYFSAKLRDERALQREKELSRHNNAVREAVALVDPKEMRSQYDYMHARSAGEKFPTLTHTLKPLQFSARSIHFFLGTKYVFESSGFLFLEKKCCNSFFTATTRATEDNIIDVQALELRSYQEELVGKILFSKINF